jgi:16S rRNA pseudouridine516 synthase
MTLARYLARLGYGTRREVEAMLRARRVTGPEGQALTDGPVAAHEDIRVDGAPLDPPPGSVILLHKPVGYVCSTSDRPPLVYDLLPPRFLMRNPVMAPVGRLDAETSGALLLTDDGPLNHRLTSPRWHAPKTYRVTLAAPPGDDALSLLAQGTLLLRGDVAPLAPAIMDRIGTHEVRVTITEGRYHQVRRMFAAVGSHVSALHRETVAGIGVDGLAPGAWRLLEEDEIQRLVRQG